MQIIIANIGTIAALIAGFTIAAVYDWSNDVCLLSALVGYSFSWNAYYSLKV